METIPATQAASRIAESTGGTNVFYSFKVYVVTLPTANRQIFQVLNGSTQLAVFTIRTDGSVNVGAPSNSSPTSNLMSTGNWYTCWFHYTAGSGANAQATGGWALSSSGIEPTSGTANYCTFTSGTATLAVDTLTIGFGSNGVGEFIIDDVIEHPTAIGNSPGA